MATDERVDLTGQLCLTEGCTKLTFSDITGFLTTPCNDEQNDQGYGLVDGIEYTDVNLAILNVYYPGFLTPYIFTFTISSGTITAATLTDVNLVITNIFSLLESTDFPLEDFNITFDYGVILPVISDGLFKWDYTISGVSDDESFSYTTSDSILSSCKANCCIENKYADLDLNCGCLEDKKKNIMESEFFLNAAKYAMNVGKDEKAQGFIDKANELCNSNCESC